MSRFHLVAPPFAAVLAMTVPQTISAQSPKPAAEAGALTVKSARMWSLRQRADGSYKQFNTNVIGNVPLFSCYFWEIEYARVRRETRITEELTTPDLGNGRQTVNMQLPVATTDKRSTFRRCVSPGGEVPGDYRVRIMEDDRELYAFTFTIAPVDPTQTDGPLAPQTENIPLPVSD